MDINDHTLASFRRALEDIYGDRLERVILFGSRARGEARPDSDYDVAVFLKSMVDRWQELDRLADLSLNFADKAGSIINALPYLSAVYQERSPLMAAIRQEGIEV
jgi:predicted nucleotidyltransferase